MSLICRHCSNTIVGEPVSGEFCCPGCREVYSLIHNQGLDDFYIFQDRVAEPLKDRALPSVDANALCATQKRVETGGRPEATFAVSGMSCMGCVWLVQRLARRRPGITQAEVSLSGNRLGLSWKPTAFSLAELGAELYRFGYSLDAEPLAAVRAWSPIAVRSLLAAVFTINALLLHVYEINALDAAAYSGLLGLLSLACLVFTLTLAMPPFVLPVYYAARIHRIHTDWVPVAVVLVALFSALAAMQLRVIPLSLGAALVSMAAFVCVFARWLGGWMTHRRV